MTTTPQGDATTPTMLIQHISDPHIGAARHGHRNPETGENTADESVIRCFEHAIRTGQERGVAAQIISGDIWDRGTPTPEMIARVIDPLRESIRNGIQVIAEDGNHGRHGVRPGHRGPAELLRAIGVTVYDQVGMHTVVTHSGPLHVLGVPWPQRAVLAHQAGVDDVDPAQLDEILADYLSELIEDQMEAADIGAGEHLVVSSHITINEGTLHRGSETVVNPKGVFEEIQLPIEALTATGAHYVALGHLHEHQHVGPRASYSGSLDRLTFGEAEDPKGTLLVGLTDADPTREFIPTPARRLLNLHLDADAEPDLSDLEPGTLVKAHLASGERVVPEPIRKTITAAGARLVKTKPAPMKRTVTATKIQNGLTLTDATRQWAKAEKLDSTTTQKLLDRINNYL